MTDEKNKLYARIIKMYRKYESLMAMGNVDEAMQFMAGVQKTLQANDLEMSEVEYHEMQKDQPIKMHAVDMKKYGLGKQKMVKWQVPIIGTCAEAHMCQVILIGKTNDFFIIGRREHRQVAEFMITTLLRFAEKTSSAQYVKRFYELKELGDVTLARGYRKGWLTGFSMQVATRYDAMAKELAAPPVNTPGNALIRLSGEMAMVKKAAEEISEKLGTEQKDANLSSHDANVIGLMDGDKAGKEIKLKQTGLSAGQAAARAVGAGQKLLGGGV